MHKIKLEKFEGPLDLLLQLIEAQEMDITQISLASVTDQYINILNEQQVISPDELADFLVIAAKLLLIKSKILLPHLISDEEDLGDDLEKQLKIYGAYLEASKKIHKIILRRRFSYFRETHRVFEPVFIPPKNIGLVDLQKYFYEVLKNIEPIVQLPKESVIRTISLQDKINKIKDFLFKESAVDFDILVKSAKSKTEIIVTFLALLELVKQKDITIFQENIFSEIKIKRINE